MESINGACGVSIQDGINLVTDTTAPYIVLPQECMTIDNLAHELGHFFGLTNTYGPTAETISLEVTNGDNCLTEGDKICDTPADPYVNGSIYESGCLFTGEVKDANDAYYDPDLSNFMSQYGSCRKRFSIDQYDFMVNNFEARKYPW